MAETKADIKRRLMRQPGIIEQLKALALSKGVKSYSNKENLVDAVIRTNNIIDLRRFAHQASSKHSKGR
jgi:hypothetical protein